jgi:hypothetical protein
MEFKDLKQPILETWDRIGHDVLTVSSEDNVTTDIVLEMCVDAGRLFETDRAAGRLAADLIDLHGWDFFVKLMKPIIDSSGSDCWR